MDLLQKVTALEQEAADFGFEWETTQQIMDQILSECEEIKEHLGGDQTALQDEIGDLLHAVFSLCVFCKFSPEETLSRTLDKFERRLNAVKEVSAAGGHADLKGMDFEALMRIWKKAKQMAG